MMDKGCFHDSLSALGDAVCPFWPARGLSAPPSELAASELAASELLALESSARINKIKKSVYSEPLAIYNSLLHLLSTDSPKKLDIVATEHDPRFKVHVATDNSAAQYTLGKGFATRSYDINNLISEIQETFKTSRFDITYSYIPGYRNPADVFSRGKVSTVAMMTGKQQERWYSMLRWELGNKGLATNFNFPSSRHLTMQVPCDNNQRVFG
jgi:hypothetical protein